MVNTGIHYIVGVVIAHYLGFKGKKKYLMGLFGVLPDIDIFFFMIQMLASSLGFEAQAMHPFFIQFIAHRGFSHSILLLVLVYFLVTQIAKDAHVGRSAAIIIGSHLIFDYFTAWKAFFLVPFSTYPFHLGLVGVYDPLLTTLSIVAITVFTFMDKDEIGKVKSCGIWLFVFLSLALPAYPVGELYWGPFLAGIMLGVIALRMMPRTAIRLCVNLTILYLGAIFVLQGFYALQITDATIQHIEPLYEGEFAFEHSFVIEQGDMYRVGLISLDGIKKEKVVPRYTFASPQTDKLLYDVHIIEKAYDDYLLTMNWINDPMWHIREVDGITEMKYKYAKGEVITDPQSEYTDEYPITFYIDQPTGVVRLKNIFFD